jgi:hypothetical protein
MQGPCGEQSLTVNLITIQSTTRQVNEWPRIGKMDLTYPGVP